MKIYVKIPSLLPSILDWSMASTKPMNIYMGVSVTAFPISYHVKKFFPNMFSNKIKIKLYKKVKVK